MIIIANAMMYILGPTQLDSGKNTIENNVIIGNFAPQGTNGVKIVVIFLSFSSSMVRVAITPGMAQPEPTIIGMIDLPDKPIFLKYRSINTATLDM